MGSQGPQALSALCEPRRQASEDNKLLLMQRMEDSSLRPWWRLTAILVKIRKEALTQKNVKNEDSSG
jgi:hypothetical protein